MHCALLGKGLICGSNLHGEESQRGRSRRGSPEPHYFWGEKSAKMGGGGEQQKKHHGIKKERLGWLRLDELVIKYI